MRRLAAILAADVAGYPRLKILRRDLIDPKIALHKGRNVKTTGDGMLVEFASAVEAAPIAAG